MTPLIAALALWSSSQAPPQPPLSVESPNQEIARMRWWRDARFGMFVHWGLYAIPAGRWDGKLLPPGGGEWIQTNAQIKRADYEPLARQWNPSRFDARSLVGLAKKAGMKYLVVTTKHHDGFGLWPSKADTWNVRRTPFKRDVLRELATECRRQGIRLCFYYSIMDWHHPDYLPKREWDREGEAKADFERYVTFMKAQLRELLTEYGDIGVLWFDGEFEGTWTHERGIDLYRFVRSIQPKLIVNNRVDKNPNGHAEVRGTVGDFGTPEQEIPAGGLSGVDWESCMTLNGTWGYREDDRDWKSAQVVVRNLIDCASKGGNYLLNIGPRADGSIPEESAQRLEEVGRWMQVNGAAIYGTSASPFKRSLPWGRVTRKGNRLFLHVFAAEDWILLPGLVTDVEKARTLADGKSIQTRRTPNGVEVRCQDLPRDSIATVIELDLRGTPRVENLPLKQAPSGRLDLTAPDAEIEGRSAKLQGDNIGFWTDLGDTVSWQFDSVPGEVKVELEYSCEPGSAGGAFAIEVAGQNLTGSVSSTGGWDSYRRLALGTIRLPGGKAKVMVRPTSMPKYALMNLRAIYLRPR